MVPPFQTFGHCRRPYAARVGSIEDVVVVLGAQVLPGGRPSTALRRRVEHAVAVRGDRPLVVCGGVGRHGPAEAVVMAALAEQHGVSRGSIVLEDRSRTTREQAEAVAALAARHGWDRVLVVSDRYHVPRARFLFRAAGLPATGSGCGRAGGSLLRWWGAWVREAGAWVKALTGSVVRRRSG
jgi:uncharacterized SAM-binding protein YcdF (DUF218 family)